MTSTEFKGGENFTSLSTLSSNGSSTGKEQNCIIRVSMLNNIFCTYNYCVIKCELILDVVEPQRSDDVPTQNYSIVLRSVDTGKND